MSKNLNVVSRDRSTRSHLRELRHNGWIPGVIYGKSVDGVTIQVNKAEFLAFLRKESRHSLVNLSIDGNDRFNAMIHELQVDPLDRQVLHVDFHQIKKGEKVNTALPIHLIGTPTGVDEGGVLEQQLGELEIRALPEALPPAIEASIADLKIGEQLRVRDLRLPEGIELRTSEDELIASIVLPKLDPVEQEETPEHPEMVEMTGEDKDEE